MCIDVRLLSHDQKGLKTEARTTAISICVSSAGSQRPPQRPKGHGTRGWQHQHDNATASRTPEQPVLNPSSSTPDGTRGKAVLAHPTSARSIGCLRTRRGTFRRDLEWVCRHVLPLLIFCSSAPGVWPLPAAAHAPQEQTPDLMVVACPWLPPV